MARICSSGLSAATTQAAQIASNHCSYQQSHLRMLKLAVVLLPAPVLVPQPPRWQVRVLMLLLKATRSSRRASVWGLGMVVACGCLAA
jgi:hypothetical protein